MSLIYKSLPYINPQKIFNIVANDNATIFLDSSLEHSYYGRYSFIGIDPVLTLTPKSDVSLKDQLQEFEALKSDTQDTNLPPFTGGLIGYLSYDYAEQLEPIVADQIQHQLQVPNYWFGLYNQVFAFDNIEKICYLFVTEISNSNSEQLLTKLHAIYDKAINAPATKITRPQGITLHSNFTKEEYANVVRQTIEYIKAGDIFEANIAQCFSGKLNESHKAHELYNYLQFKNPAPFAAYFNLNKLHILSASPERFIKISGNNVEVRPIKGTIRRDNDIQTDNLLAQTLQLSSKDRAENIMIVDLMRNDLSKICTPQSIMVSQLCGLESFTNLHHLVSVINGELKPKITTFEIIKALFPAGSISGAPKIRAEQIINQLEQGTKRGVSYGNIGYFGFNGNTDLSVAIRTITINNDNLSFHVGGAVTLHSDPYGEYTETMLKGQKLMESLGL